jgi:hemoglobin
MQTDIAITEPALAGLVACFYGRVRQDPLIGPLFNDAIDDWPRHLAKLSDFWSSVMLTSGRYKGNPVVKHFAHSARITPAMFDRWLAIWRETTAERLPPEAAAQLQTKAERIAESLQLAIRFRPGERPLGLSAAAAQP